LHKTIWKLISSEFLIILAKVALLNTIEERYCGKRFSFFQLQFYSTTAQYFFKKGNPWETHHASVLLDSCPLQYHLMSGVQLITTVERNNLACSGLGPLTLMKMRPGIFLSD
jgi:hypothetical protein